MSWQAMLGAAPLVEQRNGVEYFEVPCRSLLNRVRGSELPFERTINPYLNCEVGCGYCYARDFTEKRQGPAAPDAFERRIYAKRDAPAVLRAELARLRRAGELERPIALGTATDPYQPIERRRRLTRALLEVLAREQGLRLSITTKSDLVLRDLDLLRTIAERGHLRVNLTVTSVDRDLAQSLEPRAPIPSKRLRAVEVLARAGIVAGVFCMPILPDITCEPRALRRLVCAAKQSGAAFLAARVLTLRPGVRPAFFAWLRGARPGLVRRYERMYAQGANPPLWVRERIEQVMLTLRAQYRLPEDAPFPEPEASGARQLELFAEPAAAPERGPRPRSGPRRLPMSGAA